MSRMTQMEIVEAAVSAAGMQAARLPLQLLVGREGGYDFFEAQLPVERVPLRQQFQSAVADVFVTIRVIRVFRLLFLAEFLEGGIGAQRVPGSDRALKCRCNGRWRV